MPVLCGLNHVTKTEAILNNGFCQVYWLTLTTPLEHFFTEKAELCLINSGLILESCLEVLPHEEFVFDDNLRKKMSHMEPHER